MILEFSLSNFRSVRERQTFSMIAYSSQSKLDNTFELELLNGEVIRVVKAAGIYGANSFGKSNLLRALFNLTALVKHSAKHDIGEGIAQYDPFQFHDTAKQEPTSFEILFVKGGHKYRYSVTFNKVAILSEVLEYFPKKQKQTIFKRFGGENEQVHQAQMGNEFGKKKYDLYKNQLLLSKFGRDIPNEFMANIYAYFREIEIWNIGDFIIRIMRKSIVEDLKKSEDPSFFERLSQLIRIADTKIDHLVINTPHETQGKELLSAGARRLADRADEFIFAIHDVYNDRGEVVSQQALRFEEESTGTQFLFALGGRILHRLDRGGVIVFDEFDTGLHPALSRFLIELYNSPISNPGRSQLIFASQEPHILDKGLMRADQIWFADKNEKGETSIYAAKDFDNIREDIPFDKWYLNGKFSAVPNINSINIHRIFGHEQESH